MADKKLALPNNKPKDSWNKLRQHVDQMLMAMHDARYSWWTHWGILAEFILPRRFQYLTTANRWNRGSPINQAIIDETGTLAARTCASGLMSGVTSPSRPWLRLKLANQEVEEGSPLKEWLSEATERMLGVMGRSNYYQAKATQWFDEVVFGTAPLIIYEDDEDVIRCYNPACGEYYVALDARLEPNKLYRKFTMTVAQCVDEFGLANVSDSVRGLYQTKGGSLEKEVIVAHAIEPNDDTADAGIPKHFPWREVYWEFGSSQGFVLRTKGFMEQPFSCPRWDVVSNDAYGRSPGMDALPAIKQLQHEQKRKAQGIDKQVNPPLVADVQLKNQPASSIPGGVTYISQMSTTAPGMRPIYEVKPDLSGMMEDIKEVQGRINTIFFADLFLMISSLDTVRTATEIDARREEKLILLGPVLERNFKEGLQKDVERIFAIMLRASKGAWAMGRDGLLPLPPPEMKGHVLDVDFISMLAAAQAAASTTAIERVLGLVGNLAGVFPNAPDKIDVDEAIDEYAEKLGVTPKIIRAALAVQQIRQAKAQQQQQQQGMEQGMAAVQAAKTLSETQTGAGQSALSNILYGPGSGQQAA